MANHNKLSKDLANRLWAIANDLRGNMDSSKFKDYILGVIFYRYLSERTENYMNNLLKKDRVTYREALNDEKLEPVVKEWSIDHLGYIIKPKYLFSSFVEEIKNNTFSIEHFETAISKLTESTIGQESEAAFDKLFDDMNLQDKDLGKEVSQRTELISKVILKISDIPFDISEQRVDILGTAYMILIGLFASDAGKKGGEYYSPTCASELVSRLATVGLSEVDSVCDPCAGSGSLLLQVEEQVSSHNVTHFYAQELNGTTYNLLRMNLLMHGVPYKKFTTYNDDTLKKDNFGEKEFEIQVSNPPYSAKHSLGSNYQSDPRYSAAGVLPPKSKADFAFVEHIVYHMDKKKGRAVVLLPNGVLFRGKAEETIRRYLIDNLNCIDAIIGLPDNLFHGTDIPVIALYLKSKRGSNSDNICFIDASKYYTQDKTSNIITKEDIDRIINAYVNRKDIDKYCYIAKIQEIKNNNYNLSIPRYVDTFEKEKVTDINCSIKKIKESKKKEKQIDKQLRRYFEELDIEVEL